MKTVFLALCFIPLLAPAQTASQLQLDWDKLAANATERTEVNLDGPMLQAISRFLSDDDRDDADVKRLLSKLRGVYIHSYEYDKDRTYPQGDLDAIHEKLRKDNWGRIVQSISEEDHENAEIYLKNSSSDGIPGLVILDVEPREFTVVHIAGSIDPKDLNILGGKMGIPKVRRQR